ncbi:glutamate--tRNA ligase [Aureibaculum sp. 2210JD6-5]|uniref:glutamate--tRNA ligase n=1 Tax=Aureibaculum sp. 2210JD6-5 TaxID=3103957 RepID=UPI002AAEDF7F|nr:glutamate--tRNA ligase [Aureibaculum sp. 2210JD6-5]MDY7394679.1 glutamate--tRNA ligase [Aureibaculum sp. 2210JD6-5]
MINKVRVRFAPSPTGPLHIGGVRTALFNYLFAKKHKGTFILRIEDTDQNRYVEGAEKYIVNALNWLNIPFDEGPEIGGNHGPYRQSERKDKYKEHIDNLVASGNAYYAFDTAEKLDFHRKDHEARGKTFIYNWHNRLKLDNSLTLTNDEVKKRIETGENYVVRFKSPENETLVLNDIIRGEITIDTNVLDDKILFKSDGMPTYHLANIVDDHLMEISHVIRGEEWLPSLALHVLLYRAFGWDAPEFAHLPLILKPEGKGKLSKRDGDKLGFPVFPLEWRNNGEVSRGYREDGYFPEAVVNMLALLGWNEGEGTEKEIYSLDELIEAFSLEHVSKAGAKFNPDKTKWFNQQYLQLKSDDELADLFSAHVLAIKSNPILMESINKIAKHLDDKNYIKKVISLIKERAVFVSDLLRLGSFFFVAPTSYDEKAKKQWKEDTPELMNELVAVLNPIDEFSSPNIETTVKEWITRKEVGFGKVMQPLRLSLVGAVQGPHLFDIMELIGKEETINRVEKAVKSLP